MRSGRGFKHSVARSVAVLGTTAAIAASFLVVTTGTAFAIGANWYVNPTGSDSNTCTSAAAPCKTIAHALTLAAEGDNINLAPGTYVGSLTFTKAVNILGAGPGSSIINANETTPSASSTAAVLVSIAASDPNTLTVNGVTIENGISKFGGGIELFDGRMIVSNSTITNNSAGGMASAVGGGGIAEEGSASGIFTQLTLANDTISNNKGTSVSGGGLYLLGPATINNSTISGNSTTATTFGGGLFVAQLTGATTPGSATVTDSTISGNSAAVGGGAAVDSGGHLTLTGDGNSPDTLSSNTAIDGGAIYDAGTTSVSGSTLSGNSASTEGGGFYASQVVSTDTPTVTATNDTFSANSGAVAGGAGILLTGSTLTMNNGTATGGNALLGAGFYVSSGALANFNSATVSSNHAEDGGGLAIAGGGTANLAATTVSNNVANSGSTANLGNGGGIFDSGALTITGASTLSGNQAIADSGSGSVATGWGGALFAGPSAANNAPTVTMTSGTVIGGTLTSGTNASVGGGIAIAGNVLGTVGAGFSATPASFTGTNDGFVGLSALEGGGAYVGGTATFNGAAFDQDTATGSILSLGGGLLVGKVAAADTPSATLNGTGLNNDSAALGGGIAVNSSSSLTLDGGSTLSQDAASNSGGGLYMGGTATLTGATIEDNTAAEFAGGIFDGSVVSTDTPSLTATDVTVNQNSSPFEAGGVAVAANATLNVSGGSIDNNTAATDAGGLLVAAGGSTSIRDAGLSGNTVSAGDGGGVFNSGLLTITGSSVDSNTATPSSSAPASTGFGGAIYSGASAASVTTTLTLTADTFTANVANAASVLVTASTQSTDVNSTSLLNDTVTANTTGPSFGTIDAFNPVSIVSSTINNNTSPTGGSGGLFVEAAKAISVSGSDITGNSGANCSSAVVDGGYNQIDTGDTSCGFTVAKHDAAGNPQLGQLGANGGPTQTEVPGASSPLINRIPVNTATGLDDAVTGNPIVLCGPGAVDQRGIARPQGPTCDIGSVETGVTAPTLSGPSAATYLVGVAGAPQTFTSAGTPTPALTESGALPSGVTFTDNGNGTATLGGTPAAGTVGAYAITVTAANGTLPNASQTFTLTVDQAPALSGPTSATFTVNSPGTVAFSATGTPTPSITETGALPSGVTFTDNGNGTATLAGTPAVGTQRTYALVITAHNGEGSDATLHLTLTVLPPVTITTTALPNGTVGVAYTTTKLAATNGVKPYSWSLASGVLPAGLTLASDGTISGKPTGPAGAISFVVKVTDSATPAGTATAALSITIAKGTTSLSVDPLLLASLPGGGVVVFGSVAATLTGGSPAAPVAGQTIVFTAGTTPVCTAVTNASGVARCNITLLAGLEAVLSDGVTATYAGSPSWLGSTAKSKLIG